MITFSILLLFTIILSSGALFRKNLTFETYFDESVQGLDIGSAVKHRGVKIGTVEEITFVRSEYQMDRGSSDYYESGRYVLVKMSIPETFITKSGLQTQKEVERMIEEGLRVRLASQGLTGTAYMEVDYMNVEKNKPLDIKWKPKNIYIPSASSTMNRLTQSMDAILSKIDKADIQSVAKNIDAFFITLNESLKEAKLGELSREATGLISELRKTNQDLKIILTSNEAKSAPKKINDILTKLNTSVNRLDSILAQNSGDLGQTVENLKNVSEDLKEITGNTKKYPSMIFFGEPPKKK
jgi:ABC-type transporter Mla subunit MlaD